MSKTKNNEVEWVQMKAFHKDREGSFKKLKKSAEEGNVSSFSHLGYAYELGPTPETVNYDEALKWYEKAHEESSDVWSAIGLGRLYYFGKGVDVDYEKSWAFFKEVEDKNIPYVDLMLGRMSYLGKGVEPNINQAKKYFERAANNDNIWAIKYLGVVEQELGNFWLGLTLRAKAVIKGFPIAIKDINDQRLAG